MSWDKFNETSLPDKEAFYSSLNMQDITNVDHRHANRVFKAFKLKDLGQYHDLYVNAATIQLCETFQNFRNMCIEIYESPGLSALGLSAPGLAWQACLKKKEMQRYA